MSEGKKYDQEKPITSLFPMEAFIEISKVLTMGAKKYGYHNWRSGMDWSRIESAMLRHYAAYTQGQDIDNESGLLHTAHMACNAVFLLTYQLLGLGRDDRWKNE